jgi:hypothetical protein
MTNEEINIEIAEYCGWKNIREQDYQPIGTDPYIDGPSQVLVGIHPESDVDSKEFEVIPDYCKDLNAMAEAEELLSNEQLQTYFDVLRPVVESTAKPGRGYVFTAKASQRAKAFVITIEKWKK